MSYAVFRVASGFRLPGLGLLVLPAAPAPAWLAELPLHTALRLALHQPGLPPLPLPATVEELARAGEPRARALLLDADPAAPVTTADWLEVLALAPADELP